MVVFFFNLLPVSVLIVFRPSIFKVIMGPLQLKSAVLLFYFLFVVC